MFFPLLYTGLCRKAHCEKKSEMSFERSTTCKPKSIIEMDKPERLMKNTDVATESNHTAQTSSVALVENLNTIPWSIMTTQC